jgi:hypothetical protein
MPYEFQNIVRSYREGTSPAIIVSSLRSHPEYMNHIHEDFGFTILHAAASRSDYVLARGIFSRPSVVNIINNTSHSGKTAASIFAERGMLEFVQMSATKGVDLLMRGGESHSAIYHLFVNEQSREYALNYLRQD